MQKFQDCILFKINIFQQDSEHFCHEQSVAEGSAALPMYFLNLLFFPRRQRTGVQRRLQNTEVFFRKSLLWKCHGVLLMIYVMGMAVIIPDLTPRPVWGRGGAGESWPSALSLGAWPHQEELILETPEQGSWRGRQRCKQMSYFTDISLGLHKQVRALGCTSSHWWDVPTALSATCCGMEGS